MTKTFPVRYGRNYKVVLAIVLPGSLTLPFIIGMNKLSPLPEWQLWTGIFLFLAAICGFSIWLAARAYPAATLVITEKEISLTFDRTHFLHPADFTFPVSEITTFAQCEISGIEYFVIETQRPRRKFQLSAATHSMEDIFVFTEAMVEIGRNKGSANQAG